MRVEKLRAESAKAQAKAEQARVEADEAHAKAEQARAKSIVSEKARKEAEVGLIEASIEILRRNLPTPIVKAVEAVGGFLSSLKFW